MAKILWIGFLIGFLFFGVVGIFVSGNEWLFGFFLFGIVGGFFTLLISYPVGVVLEKDDILDAVEASLPIPIGEPDFVRGLWRDGRHLVIDFESAIFPSTCLYTGEQIDELLPIKLLQIETPAIGPIKKTYRVEFLPVSKSWLNERLIFAQRMRKYLLFSSVFFYLLMVALICLGFGLAEILIANSCAFLTLVIGIVLPRAEGFGERREITKLRFLGNGLVLIFRPAPEFIDGLPDWKE